MREESQSGHLRQSRSSRTSAGPRGVSFSAEEKIRIVLDGLRGQHSIAELCRRESVAKSLYYSWSKDTRRRRGRGRPPSFAFFKVKHLRQCKAGID